jgi:hypothetical protein
MTKNHIDLTDVCIPAVSRQNRGKLKKGDYYVSWRARKQATDSLNNFLGTEVVTNKNIHTCHACKNDSSHPNGFVCINPKHLYFGTAKQNQQDIPEKDRSERSKKACGSRKNSGKTWKPPKGASEKGIKSQISSGNHMNQKKEMCIYCNKISNPGVIAQWHNNKCKHKQTT